MKIQAALFLSLTAFFVSSQAFAANFFVSEAQLTGVGESWKVLVPEFIKSELSAQAKHSAAVTEASSDFTLVPKLFKLEDHYFVVVEKLEKGQVKYTSSIKIMTSDDIDVAFRRTTRSAISETPVADTADIHTVTQRESRKGTPVKSSRFSFGAGIGPTQMFNMGTDRLGTNFSLHGSWGREALTPYIRGDVVSETGKGDASYAAFGIGANMYLNDESIAPYVGGDFALASIMVNAPGEPSYFGETPTASDSGFALSANAGLQFLRTHRVKMDTGLRYTAYLGKVNGKAPSMLGAQISIRF